jgi:hypothetical protein
LSLGFTGFYRLDLAFLRCDDVFGHPWPRVCRGEAALAHAGLDAAQQAGSEHDA